MTIQIPPPIANQVTVFLTVNAHKERDGFVFFYEKINFPVPIERIPHISPQCEFLGRKNQLENGETEIDKSIRKMLGCRSITLRVHGQPSSYAKEEEPVALLIDR